MTAPLQIALYQPQIPPNTGNIIRLCANTGCKLHLIEPLGFDLEEKALRRAGLDYHEWAEVATHKDFEAFLRTQDPMPPIYTCTTRGKTFYNQITYSNGAILLFGSETTGLPDTIHNHRAITQAIRIPMLPTSRSLNLSNSVAIIAYEALSQLNWPGLI